MAFNNPRMSWSELEAKLSGKVGAVPPVTSPPTPPVAPPPDGGDAPGWSRKRAPYRPPPGVGAPGGPGRPGRTPYAELHCHSNFSFLDGAAHPEQLAEEAARLGLEALAITDHDGVYGVVRFAEAARAVGLPTVFGAELTLDRTRRSGAHQPLSSRAQQAAVPLPDPDGRHLVVLADGPDGYARLCRAITTAHLAGGEKGNPVIDLATLATIGRGHWHVLTGCRKGAVPKALVDDGPAAAERELRRLVDAFGAANVAVELWDHGDPLDAVRNDAMVRLAERAGLGVVATANAHYDVPARRPLATALAAVRARRSLDDIDGWLPAAATAHLRSGSEQAARFARYPGAVEHAAELGRAFAFDLKLVAPRLPDYPVPPVHTEMTWLRVLTEEGARRRYGPRDAERVPGAYAQIDHELALVDKLGFAGYFLIVWDIVEFCRRSNILCQGRGSAANSAVCYALGITNADAVSLGLLFERFLSPERDGPPDIDVDIESDRREEAIQYVYERYGRDNAAQVANVITYRPRSAVRDMGRALGFAPGQLDAWSKQVEAWGPLSSTTEHDIPALVFDLAEQLQHAPRHLGIHSGGMVICDRPVVEVCPVEWGRMEARSVLQWDKDDCAAAGLVKIDLLGLGMLSALHYGIDLIKSHHGIDVDLAALPQEDEVYDMLCAADTIGVFQVESRAQMATLPRLKPRCFYDIVVEVALIRPGPIQGGSVHPYIRRRNGEEPVTYLHPLLERSLAKTLGVPLFQEQLMQMAIDVAGFTPGEADQLRQAMGSKRSPERMERLRGRLYDGMAVNGITGAAADELYEKLSAFANFGFPESHSVSFAYLVYSSAWMKLHYPAAFCAALLNAQPMGFYSPQSLVADARRHGVTILGPDVNASAATATLEGQADAPMLRLGVGSVRAVGTDLADRIAEGRPYTSMDDLARRAAIPLSALEALATAGALGSLPTAPSPSAGFVRSDGVFPGDANKPGGLNRREALWTAGAVVQEGPGRLPGIVTGAVAPSLPGMDEVEEALADVWATGVSPSSYPTQFVRDRLDSLGVITAAGLASVEHRTRVLVGGVVTHRQRPATAGGTTFLNLEDETGLVNVICSPGFWARNRRVARGSPALLIRGRLERVEGVINVIAEQVAPLSLAGAGRSRDFR